MRQKFLRQKNKFLFFVLTFFAYIILNKIVLTFSNKIEYNNTSVAPTPPMGWMSWERYRCNIDCNTEPDECISENLFRRMSDLLVSEGYSEVGYKYVIVDDCWLETERNSFGYLEADKERFPNGMKNLGDYIHNKGLKYGLYENFGKRTCEGYPGTHGKYLQRDAETFVEWGADYVKLDACFTKVDLLERGYQKFGKYLKESGKPILFSCSMPYYLMLAKINVNYNKLAKVCHTWRNYHDIHDSWSVLANIIDWYGKNSSLGDIVSPGGWNDPDMLIIGNYGLTLWQSRLQFAIWAILAAPLIMSNNLETVRPEFKEILQNKDIIAINQDPLGIAGRRVYQDKNFDVWIRKITPIVDDRFSFAIAVVLMGAYHRPKRFTQKISAIHPDLDANKYYLKDLYEPQNSPKDPTDTLKVSVPPSGGVVIYKAIPVKKVHRKESYQLEEKLIPQFI